MQAHERVGELLSSIGVGEPPLIDDAPLAPPPIHALSLAIAQKCNLGCTYCYAQQGAFGGQPKNMPLETANRAVDLLLAEAGDGGKASLAFLGGEPLVNRPVLQVVTQRAAELAARRGIALSFSITTNGTLLTQSDAEFFEQHGFAVTVSLDGPREIHDRTRPYKSGAGSFDRIMRNLRPLLARQRRMQVSARVTVTLDNLDLRRTLDDFIAAGVHRIGFSPMLSAPGGRGELQTADLVPMLDAMIDCGRAFERRLVAGERYPFDNMVNAMREIHRGTHRPYPCGAGAAYLGVSADGELSACHRFVEDAEGAMGTLSDVDRDRRARWLAERHVHRTSPGTVHAMLGALPVRRRLSSREHPPRPPFVRLYSRLVALLLGRISATFTTTSRLVRAGRHRVRAAFVTLDPGPNQLVDVCIIGAGPAGSTLAIRLAQLGYDVCVVERRAFSVSTVSARARNCRAH
jgi:uncharacterized protein